MAALSARDERQRYVRGTWRTNVRPRRRETRLGEEVGRGPREREKVARNLARNEEPTSQG